MPEIESGLVVHKASILPLQFCLHNSFMCHIVVSFPFSFLKFFGTQHNHRQALVTGVQSGISVAFHDQVSSSQIGHFDTMMQRHDSLRASDEVYKLNVIGINKLLSIVLVLV